MELERLPYNLTICKVASVEDVVLTTEFFFLAGTDEEISLVCRTEDVPQQTTEREDHWKGFRVRGVLDFSLVGILAKLAGVLAENGIPIFAVSTYNTDYLLVKEENFDRATAVLTAAGYLVSGDEA